MCLSLHMEQLGSHGTRYLSIFWKSVLKIEASLQCDKNSGYFTRKYIYVCGSIPPNSYQNEKCIRKIGSENKKKTLVYVQQFFFLKSCYFWDNVEKYDIARQATDDSMIQHMCFACWITNATNTPLEYVILNAFLQWQWFVSLLRCMYFVCLDWIAVYVLH